MNIIYILLAMTLWGFVAVDVKIKAASSYKDAALDIF
jgi:hypothetical protein